MAPGTSRWQLHSRTSAAKVSNWAKTLRESSRMAFSRACCAACGSSFCAHCHGTTRDAAASPPCRSRSRIWPSQACMDSSSLAAAPLRRRPGTLRLRLPRVRALRPRDAPSEFRARVVQLLATGPTRSAAARSVHARELSVRVEQVLHEMEDVSQAPLSAAPASGPPARCQDQARSAESRRAAGVVAHGPCLVVPPILQNLTTSCAGARMRLTAARRGSIGSAGPLRLSDGGGGGAAKGPGRPSATKMA
mmetsp:Transcript_66238/g.194278  ORF Transcript_66238/g.194278 Transcript_66238/m.194278 type:complete len:249 (+) Transcript_66238:131-877(+)